MPKSQSGKKWAPPITEYQFVPILQKNILCFLAESKPHSRYSTMKAIKGHYKSVYNAFDALLEKGIVTEIESPNHLSKKYPVYWLTTAGIFIALVEGANQKMLLNRTPEIYPDDKRI